MDAKLDSVEVQGGKELEMLLRVAEKISGEAEKSRHKCTMPRFLEKPVFIYVTFWEFAPEAH